MGRQRRDCPVYVEIVVPAHNEAGRLPAGLAALCRKAASLPLRAAVLVVDSASTDGTSRLVRDWPAGPVEVRLLRCDQPGKGLAVRTGLLATRAPFVGFCDADMATDLSALDLTLSLLAAGRPMVIGSRVLAGSVAQQRHSVIRRLGAATFHCLARRIVPGVSDTQCGFKFFSGPLARAAAVQMRTAGFAFDVELIALCQGLGAGLTEIPVIWRDMPGSTFSLPHHSVGTLRDLAAISLRPPVRPSATPVLAGLPSPAVLPPALPAAAMPA